jgi:hypothetical protein
LTAAVRDLHLTHSHRFITDVRTSCPDLWENNPYLTPLSDKDPEAEVVECEFPLINQSNRGPYHAIHGYTDFLSGHLQVPLNRIVAVLFVVISIASAWATQRFGSAGIYALAAIVGVSDIDPFVLNLAQGDPAQITVRVGAGAILVAASSNNVLKAVYAIVYSSAHVRVAPAALAVLAACGIATAVVM